MNSFVEDLKVAWNRQNSGLSRLIIINVVVFIAISIISVVSKIGGFEAFYHALMGKIAIPSYLGEFAIEPWTLLSYSFTHEGFFHLLFNMLMLYWFGLLVGQFMGNNKLVALYLYGAIAGGLLYLLVYNTIPFFEINRPGVGMFGASASVYAIIAGIATLMPEYSVHLLIFGPVRLKYIAAITIFLSFIGTAGGNGGGNVAHLGGALMGFVFVAQLRRGHDWSLPVARVAIWFENMFRRKPKMRVSHRNDRTGASNPQGRGQSAPPSQEEIDRILDKISMHGYASLTTEEKQTLLRASKK